ncbi:MAG TPA: transposase [Bryobacteraceae bacterium]|nr:transposase [Bryobacteraceae bacterium]
MARRKFSKEFKVAAIRRLQSGQTAAEVARALEVHRSELHRWRHELDEHGEPAFQGVGKKRGEESRVADRERKIGQQTLEIDFLRRALQHVEEQRLLRSGTIFAEIH